VVIEDKDSYESEKQSFIEALQDLDVPYNQELSQAEALSSERFYEVDPGVLKVKTFIIPFHNKLNYLFSDWMWKKDKSFEVRKSELLWLKDMIRLDDVAPDPQVVEVGWSVTYNVHPSKYTKDSRRVALMQFMRHTRDHLNNGMFGYKPAPGIVLTARPVGPRLDLGFTDESLMIGQRTRASFAQRFGFGPLQRDGFVYAIYDNDCKIVPLDLEK
jgi:hypothetical protein